MITPLTILQDPLDFYGVLIMIIAHNAVCGEVLRPSYPEHLDHQLNKIVFKGHYQRIYSQISLLVDSITVSELKFHTKNRNGAKIDKFCAQQHRFHLYTSYFAEYFIRTCTGTYTATHTGTYARTHAGIYA